MYARVSKRQIQSGQVDEAVRILRDQTVPTLREQRGFKGGLVLTDRNTGKLITISLWETEVDLRAHNPPGYHGAVAVGEPVREVYEVSAQETMGEATHAGVTFGQVQPGKMDEYARINRDSQAPLSRQWGGWKGGLWLTDPTTGKRMGISLWETEADMKAFVSGGSLKP